MRVSDGPLHRGRREPGRQAIVRGTRIVTYGELAERADEARRRVECALGADSGAPVAFTRGEPEAFLASFLGVCAAGAAAMPLSASWTVAEREAALAACPPALLLEDKDTSVSRQPLPALVPPGDSPPFYVGFSSGSSGRPKAIVRRHRAWLQSFLAMSVEFGTSAESRVAVPGSLFYSFSLIAALHALYVGATVVVPAAPGLDAATAAVTGADTAYVLPSLLDAIAGRAVARRERYPGVRSIICAGEKLQPATRAAAREAFPGADVIEYYGASELGFVTVLDGREAEARQGSVGRPFLGTELAVLRDDGAPCAVGEAGIVCARNEYGFAGYAGDPAGAAAIDHHGWSTVGDVGWLDADGYLYLAGRRDSMLVIKGVNVYPEQVEGVLLEYPAVAEAAVAGEPAAQPRQLVAYVVAAAPCDPRELVRHCGKRLPRQAVPRRIEFVRELPRTATGKVARDELGRRPEAAP